MRDWKKALTFSYDDGVTQDKRLIELLNKYGMKGTFNLNSELLGREDYLIREGVRVSHIKVDPGEVREIYAGHEIAAHTLTHPNLAEVNDDREIVEQVERDRENLSRMAGYEVVGMAYPGGGVNYTPHVARLVEQCTGIRYARTTVASYDFHRQENLYEFRPTVYHVMEPERLFELGKRFLELEPPERRIFYVWGHSYEFDVRNAWGQFESFLEMMSGRDDILYGTNREVLL